jgi:RNA polymerase sigma factor for flagellar operon FliA
MSTSADPHSRLEAEDLADDGAERSLPPPPASRVRLGEEGDSLPSTEIVTQHLHLVHGVVHRLARRLPPNVERDDLVAAGTFGLVEALRRNRGDEGATFAWYARTRIRGAVVDELRAQDWLSRRARDRATSDKAAGGAGTAFVSLEEAGLAAESGELASSADPAAEAEAKSDRRALSRALERLPERERQVITMHYFEGAKLKTIGVSLGVSEPRVSQLHARAIAQLRVIMVDDRAA